MPDNAQQRAALRGNATARKVRRLFGEGTRVVATRGAGEAPGPGAQRGTVQRHVPMTNAQGGVLVVQWDNGSTGRHSACMLAREDQGLHS